MWVGRKRPFIRGACIMRVYVLISRHCIAIAAMNVYDLTLDVALERIASQEIGSISHAWKQIINNWS